MYFIEQIKKNLSLIKLKLIYVCLKYFTKKYVKQIFTVYFTITYKNIKKKLVGYKVTKLICLLT